MIDNPTVFQRLTDETQAQKMIKDLRDLEGLVPEGNEIEDVEGWELALSFNADDVPYIIEELEELLNEPQ